MVELAAGLPSGPLTRTDLQDLRARQSVSSVIELPSSKELHRKTTSRATVLAEGTVFYLMFDAESERWTQTALADDADRQRLLEEALDRLDETE